MSKAPLDEDARIRMHSGDYVQVLENIPISRLTRLLGLMPLRRTDTLYDLGCGPGALSHLVHQRVASYHGVDFAPDFVAAARAAAARLGITNAEFHCQDIVEFCGQRPDSADVITAFDFSEHIYDEDFIRVFSAAFHALKPGGKLLLYTPNLDFFYERMKDRGLARQFPQHIAVRDAAQHRRLLEQCGFPAASIACAYPSHYNVFRHLHPLSRLPLLGKWLQAKLFFTCEKPAPPRAGS